MKYLCSLVISMVLLAACSGSNGDATDDCEPYAGVWISTEEFGSPEDEGGIYRIRLELPLAGEVSLLESDTIEVWDSWDCQDGTITVVTSSGEVRTLATIVDDDMLTTGRATLLRND